MLDGLTGWMRNAYRISENRKVRDHLEDLGVDGTIALEQILRKKSEQLIGFIWLRIGTSGALL